MGTVSVQGNRVYCPLDHTTMNFVRTVPHEDSTDCAGKPIKVTRKYFVCPKCNTIIAFAYREDGKRGELKAVMDAEKEMGVKFFNHEVSTDSDEYGSTKAKAKDGDQ